MKAKTYSATEHDFDHNLIDRDALQILKRLQDAGHIAYLVGGGVRDLLAKKTPKDFDISTSATPEEIKAIFRRNCILIGRRFRLAHIKIGHKTFEVSTFRTGENDDELIIQDNRWGSPEEDVLRRDFTINGLFYDAATNHVIDFVGGWEDLHNGVIRTIGEPTVRFRQDPVRMIRLLKFEARFGFKVDPETDIALIQCRDEIVKSAPARILEELFRMLESGASRQFFELMTQSGLLKLLFPNLDDYIKGEHGQKIYQFLKSADKMNLTGQKAPLHRCVLATSLLYPILEIEIKQQFLDQGHHPSIGDVMLLTSQLIRNLISSSFSHFPKKITSGMSFILSAQYRLTPVSGKKHFRPKLVRNKEFPLALTFLKMRALIDPTLLDDYRFWQHHYQQMLHHHEKGEKKNHHHRPPLNSQKEVNA